MAGTVHLNNVFIETVDQLTDNIVSCAQFELGVLFYTGTAGSTTIPRDFKEAGKYLRLFSDSFFTDKNMDAKAIKEILEQGPEEEVVRAERAGVTAALLGKMYWRGEGYDVDEAQALNWFKKGTLVVSVTLSSVFKLIN